MLLACHSLAAAFEVVGLPAEALEFETAMLALARKHHGEVMLHHIDAIEAYAQLAENISFYLHNTSRHRTCPPLDQPGGSNPLGRLTHRYARAKVPLQPKDLRDRQLIVRLVIENYEADGTRLPKVIKAKLRSYAYGKLDLVQV